LGVGTGSNVVIEMIEEGHRAWSETNARVHSNTNNTTVSGLPKSPFVGGWVVFFSHCLSLSPIISVFGESLRRSLVWVQLES